MKPHPQTIYLNMTQVYIYVKCKQNHITQLGHFFWDALYNYESQGGHPIKTRRVEGGRPVQL